MSSNRTLRAISFFFFCTILTSCADDRSGDGYVFASWQLHGRRTCEENNIATVELVYASNGQEVARTSFDCERKGGAGEPVAPGVYDVELLARSNDGTERVRFDFPAIAVRDTGKVTFLDKVVLGGTRLGLTWNFGRRDSQYLTCEDQAIDQIEVEIENSDGDVFRTETFPCAPGVAETREVPDGDYALRIYALSLRGARVYAPDLYTAREVSASDEVVTPVQEIEFRRSIPRASVTWRVAMQGLLPLQETDRVTIDFFGLDGYSCEGIIVFGRVSSPVARTSHAKSCTGQSFVPGDYQFTVGDGNWGLPQIEYRLTVTLLRPLPDGTTGFSQVNTYIDLYSEQDHEAFDLGTLELPEPITLGYDLPPIEPTALYP